MKSEPEFTEGESRPHIGGKMIPASAVSFHFSDAPNRDKIAAAARAHGFKPELMLSRTLIRLADEKTGLKMTLHFNTDSDYGKVDVVNETPAKEVGEKNRKKIVDFLEALIAQH